MKIAAARANPSKPEQVLAESRILIIPDSGDVNAEWPGIGNII
jgi:hypothetical protein